MSVTISSPTAALSDFTSRLNLSDLPPRVRERVKDILLDTLASALSGHDASESNAVVDAAGGVFGAGDSTVIGGGSLSPAGAAMANGYLITAVTVCDVYRPTLCHITPEVVPPALTVTEEVNAHGRDLLVAVAAGLEIAARVGLGINYPEFRSRGWHSPGVSGTFGGAAAAARLLGLESKQTNYAFGIAGSQATGSFAQLGTPGIKFSQARGAFAGLMSAELAATGFTASDEILVSPVGGLYRTHSDGGNPERALEGLGETWELEDISLRPWPVGAYLQTVVSVVLPMVNELDLSLETVAKVRLWLSSNAHRLHGHVDPSDRFRARLAPGYVVAAVIRDRRCWLDQFTEEMVGDPTTQDFVHDRVGVFEDSELDDTAVRAELELTDGRTIQAIRSVSHGDASDPLTRAEIVEKFRAASSNVLSESAAESVIEQVGTLENVEDAKGLVGYLRREGGIS